MNPTVVTGPTLEPITLDEAKDHCRIDGTDEDTHVESLISTARRYVERVYNRALNTQTLDYALDAFPYCGDIQLPRAPLISVTSVTYYDEDLSTSTVFASSNYQVDTFKEPGRIVLKNGSSWPTDSLRLSSGVVVRYVAGFGATQASVPDDIKHAIKLLVGGMYTHREPEVTGTIVSKIGFAVDSLLTPWRVYG